MAYDIEHLKKNTFWKGQTELMVSNARKVNSKAIPDGFLYFIKLKGFDIYKIGVTSNLKRRLYDIDSNSPFGVKLIDSFFFKNVYEMEEMIHDNLKGNNVRKDWFKLDSDYLKVIIDQVGELSKEGYYLIRK